MAPVPTKGARAISAPIRATGILSRRAWLLGVSLPALAIGLAAATPAEASKGVSLATLAKSASIGAVKQATSTPAAAAASVAAGTISNSAAASLLAQKAQIAQATNDLGAAMTAIKNANSAQKLKANAALSVTNSLGAIGNGTAANGLVQYSGKSDTTNGVNGGLIWQGASAPVSTTTATGTTVTITQSAAQAVLTWSSFNVGAKTTLVYQAGTGVKSSPDWITLNRVVAGPVNANGTPTQADPSYILGKIQAPWQIWIINPNGVIFEPGSQVNVGSLLVSTLDVGDPWETVAQRNQTFLNLANSAPSYIDLSYQYEFQTNSDGTRTLTNGLPTLATDSTGQYLVSYNQLTGGGSSSGKILVATGAQISTNAVSVTNSYLGTVVLAGPVVENDGAISTPDGQTVLAGGQFVQLIANVTTTDSQNNPESVAEPNLRGLQVYTGTGPSGRLVGLNSAAPDGENLSKPGSTTIATYIAQGLVDAATSSLTVLLPENPLTNMPDTALADSIQQEASNSALLQGGTAINKGIIEADRGNITITATKIEQQGVLVATTSVKESGSIYLTGDDIFADGTASKAGVLTASSIDLAAGSVTTILPDTETNADGTTPTIPEGSAYPAAGSGQASTYTASVITISADSVTLDAGATTSAAADYAANQANYVGGTGDGALIEAPGATISIRSTAILLSSDNYLSANTNPGISVSIGSNAAVDAAGLMDVARGATYELITAPRLGLNDLADSPLQKSGPLYTASVTFNRFDVPTIFDAAAYVALFPLDISALMEAGGKVSISGATVLNPGAVINVAGGYDSIAAGVANTTRLVVAGSGAVVDIADASPDVIYSAIAGAYTIDHTRWGYSSTYYADDGLNPNQYNQAYVVGAAAGSVTIAGVALLNGELNGQPNGQIMAGAVAGPTQRTTSSSAPPTTPAALGGTIDLSQLQFLCLGIGDASCATASGNSLPTAGTFDSYAYQSFDPAYFETSGATTILIGAAPNLNSAINTATNKVENTLYVGAGAALTLLPGTALTLAASHVEIDGSIRIPDGSVTVALADPSAPTGTATYHSSFLLASGASIDLSGLTAAGLALLNDSNVAPDDLIGRDYINGGSLTITSSTNSGSVESAPTRPVSVDFASGSTVNLDSSGYVGTTGALAMDSSSGRAYGTGGSLSILLHNAATLQSDPVFSVNASGNPTLADALTLGSTLSAFGFDSGGTFALQAPNLVIGGGGALGVTMASGTGTATISDSFFGSQGFGFGNFALTSLFTTSIVANTNLRLEQANYQLVTGELGAVTALTTGVYDGTLRPATDLSITSLGLVDPFTVFNNKVDQKDTKLANGGVLYVYPNNGSNLNVGVFTGGAGGQVADNTLVVNAGSVIIADPGATISLSADGEFEFAGLIIAPGGTVSLSQKSVTERSAGLTTAGAAIYINRALDLANGSLIDTSAQAYLAVAITDFLYGDRSLDAVYTAQGATDQIGVYSYVPNPNVVGFRSGTVLSGGTVNISATVLYGETGSAIDVSGGAATLDVSNGTVQTSGTVPELIATNAGSIVITAVAGPAPLSNSSGVFGSASAAYIDTTMVGTGGDSAVANLTISVPDALIRTFSTGNAVTTPLSTVANEAGPLQYNQSQASDGYINALALDQANADTLVIGGTFEGSVSLTARREIDVASQMLNWVGDTTGGNQVVISAPIIRLGVNTLLDSGVQGLSLGPGSVANSAAAAQGTMAADGCISTAGCFTFSASETLDVGQIQSYSWGFSSPGYNPVNEFPATGQGILSYSTISLLNLESADDIRLLGPTGYLAVGGYLSLQAAEIYPTTGTNFLIQSTYIPTGSTGPGSAVTFARTSGTTPAAPLSAGATLTVSAYSIDQGGALYAPFGTIDLGIGGSTAIGETGSATDFDFAATAAVTFEPNSTTSVSGEGLLVPYGQTENSINWSYGDTFSGLTPTLLAAAPTGTINVYASAFEAAAVTGTVATFESTLGITLHAGATLNLNGGGDVFATEFVSGTGGSKNVLTTAIGSNSNAAIYAIVPSYQGDVAPVDLGGYSGAETSSAAYSADPSLFAIGRTLTLAQPAAGLAAGTYTLLPATYATLPGAVRVQVVTNTTTVTPGTSSTLTDGSVATTATLGYANGERNGTASLVELQTASVWEQYSDIQITQASSYFAQIAATEGTLMRMPADAGHLILRTASLNEASGDYATFDMTPASGGKDGELDLTGNSIEVYSADQTPDLNPNLGTNGLPVQPPLLLTPAEITNFNAGSVMLGGVRTLTSTGESIAVNTPRVEIKTDATDPLVAPDLIIVAGAAATPVPTTNTALEPLFVEGQTTAQNGTLYSIDIKAGSEILTNGAVNGFSNETYTVTSGKGDAAYLRVSGGTAATVATSGSIGTGIYVGHMVTLGAASEATGAVEVGASGSLIVPADVTINAADTSFIGGQAVFTTAAAASSNAFALAESLANSADVSVRGTQSIEFDTAFQIGSSGSTQSVVLDAPSIQIGTGASDQIIAINASMVTITNSSDAPATTGTGTGGILDITAGTVNLTGNSRQLVGFAEANITATTAISIGTLAVTGTWSLPDTGTAGGGLFLSTPIVELAGGNQTLDVAGAITATSSGAPATSSSFGGGSLTVIGSSVTVGTYVSARAGDLTLHATTGSVEITSTGTLDAQGFSESFRNEKTIIAPAGSITLQADSGNIELDQGSTVTVAGVTGGDAGSITLVTGPSGTISTASKFIGTSGGDGTAGGSLSLVSGGAVNLDTLLATATGFTQSVSVEAGQGNLVVDQSLTASNVYLSADQGTVTVSNAITALSASGGIIQLYGTEGVTLAGATITAGGTATAPDGMTTSPAAGTLTIGTGTYLDANNQLKGGVIDVTGASINVTGGTVHLRAPFVDANGDAVIASATSTDQAITTIPIVGLPTAGTSSFNAGQVIIEPYQRVNINVIVTAANPNGFIGGVDGTVDDWSIIYDAFDGQFAQVVTTKTGSTPPAPNWAVGPVDKAIDNFETQSGVAYNGGAGYEITPGLELFDDGSVNSGNITITQPLDLYTSSQQIYNYAKGGSQTVTTYYDTRYGNDQMPGILTIRAAGDVHVDASISDGFFDTTTYQRTGPAPALNSPQQGTNKVASVEIDNVAVLEPVLGQFTGVAPDSSTGAQSLISPLTWSYRFVSGAGITAGSSGESADPLSLAAATTFDSGALANEGNFILGEMPGGFPTIGAAQASYPLNAPIAIRTGTGSIDIAAGGHGICPTGESTCDRIYTPTTAEGNEAAVEADVQTALSNNEILLPTRSGDFGFTLNANAAVMYLSPTATIYTTGYDNATSAGSSGSLPSAAIQDSGNTEVSGVKLRFIESGVTTTNTALFGEDGGTITVTAPNGSIVGQANFHDAHNVLTWGSTFGSDLNENPDYWLLGDSPANNANGSGADQWVNTGTFADGLAAFGGGNITLRSGVDVSDLAASIISTYRVIADATGSGSTVESYGGGNLTISAVAHVDSVTGFVEQGDVTVTAGQDIGASYTEYFKISSTGGSVVSTAGSAGQLVSVSAPSTFILSGASLNAISRGSVNDILIAEQVETVGAPAFAGVATASGSQPNAGPSVSYGPQTGNAVSVIAVNGDVTFGTPQIAGTLTNGSSYRTGTVGTEFNADAIALDLLPSQVTVAALAGSLNVENPLYIAPSENGSNIVLLAQGSIVTTSPGLGNTGVAPIEQINLDPSQFVTQTSGYTTASGILRLSYFSDIVNEQIPGNSTEISVPLLQPVLTDPATGGNFEYSAPAGYELDDANGPLAGLANAYHAAPIVGGLNANPDLIIALTGDIANGTDPEGAVTSAYFAQAATLNGTYGRYSIYLDNDAEIYAGRDIVNMQFVGQNTLSSQATVIEAGRDITYTTGPDYSYALMMSSAPVQPLGSNFAIGGSGQFTLIAGRDLNLDPSVEEPNGSVRVGGIQAVGDRINPYLPNETATAAINVVYGVGPGVDASGFIAQYLDPTNAADAGNLETLAAAFGIGSDASSITAALQKLQALQSYEQQLPYLSKVLYADLQAISDPSQPVFKDYLAADELINALFPYQLGYTQYFTTSGTTNTLLAKPIFAQTGTLNISGGGGGALIETNYGAPINVIGPGGSTIIGDIAQPAIKQAQDYGLLAVNGGAIDMFTAGDIDVNSSKILALDGGDLVIYSGDGNIDAGRGKKTTSYIPPFAVDYSPYLGIYANPLGDVSGAGIGTLVTIPGSAPGNAYLLAPNGTINAGDAGIRSSGNLFLVALQVIAGGGGFSAHGTISGIPAAPVITTAALSAAGSAESAGDSNDPDKKKKKVKKPVPSIITVGFVNFGEAAPGDSF